MATLNAVILPAKALKNGRHKIRISIAHNGETRYMVTDIVIDSAKEFKNGTIIKRPDAAILNTKLRGLLQRYQGVVDELQYVNGLTCPELVFQIKNAGNYTRRSIGSIMEEYFENAQVKASTIMTYRIAWRRVAKIIDERLIIDNINHATILKLQNALFKRKFKGASIRLSLTVLAIALNYAKRCGYVQYRLNPFAGISMPGMETRESWLSVNEVKTIRDLKLRCKGIRRARDYFMLSYYLGGINMADLCKINFNEQTDTLHYIRQKTENKFKLNKFVEFKIPNEAKEIIKRYKQPDGLLAMPKSQRSNNMCYSLYRSMRNIAQISGIHQLIFYSARKSFSQHAFNLGVSESVIDYILGHKVNKGSTSLYNYITVTPQMATKAIRLVLDNLK